MTRGTPAEDVDRSFPTDIAVARFDVAALLQATRDADGAMQRLNAALPMDGREPQHVDTTELVRAFTEYFDAARAECEAEITALKHDAEQYKFDYEHACSTIAATHAAAVGEVTGPKRGVVEDVDEIRSTLDEAEASLTSAYEEVAILRERISDLAEAQPPTRPPDEAAVQGWFLREFPEVCVEAALGYARSICATFHTAQLQTLDREKVQRTVSDAVVNATGLKPSLVVLNHIRDAICTTFHAPPPVTDAPPLGWVNVYPKNSRRLLYSSRADAKEHATQALLRTIPVYEHPPQPLQPLVRTSVRHVVDTAYYRGALVKSDGETIDAITDAVMALDAERAE